MSYMLLILEPVGQREARGEAAGREAYAQMQRYAADLKARGLLRSAESLTHLRSATRVGPGPAQGAMPVLDGPFAGLPEPRAGRGDRPGLPGCRMGHRGSARARPLLPLNSG
jgi:hypothetical protein